MTPFNVLRLRSARSLRGLTKVKLAELCGLTPRTLTLYEKQHAAPESFLKTLCNVLGFPYAFFVMGASLPEIDLNSVSFRSTARMPAATRAAALAFGQLALVLYERMDQEFVLPTTDLPALSLEFGAEAAAESLRTYWNLGELSITNVVHLLESKGIRVFSMSINSPHVDAFSMWRDDVPFVFLNSFKSSERSRFDACHELAHLVLHRGSEICGKEAEIEANAFASAFLMPHASVLALGRRARCLDQLIRLKKRWGVSLAALVRRLRDLDLLTAWQYRTLYVEMSKWGYLRTEPEGSPSETSLILSKILGAMRQEGRAAGLSQELGLDSADLNSLTFGLSLVVHSSPASRSHGRTGRSHLELVPQPSKGGRTASLMAESRSEQL